MGQGRGPREAGGPSVEEKVLPDELLSARRERRRRAPRRRWPYVLAVLLPAGGIVGAWLALAPGFKGRFVGDLPAVGFSSTEAVTLYFADARQTKLLPEARQLAPRSDAVAQMRAVFDALAAGPRSDAAPVLPKGSRLRGAYVGKDGLAVLDLEPWPDGTELGGISGELLTVSSLVETVAGNVRGVKSVQLLVGGQERETLDGHVKISEPLIPEGRPAGPGR